MTTNQKIKPFISPANQSQCKTDHKVDMLMEAREEINKCKEEPLKKKKFDSSFISKKGKKEKIGMPELPIQSRYAATSRTEM